MRKLPTWHAGLALLTMLSLALPADAQDAARQTRTVATRYYTLQTDVPEDTAREAYIRMDRMFEEYSQRTSQFSRPPQEKMLFRLFAKAEDYYANGGSAGSAGVFKYTLRNDRPLNGRLMAIARGGNTTWHVVQHEGFHQFAAFAISPHLPVWVNEGLAEYFGEAQFVGDAFVSGMVPETRRREVLALIEGGKHHPFGRFVAITSAEWRQELSRRNYTQAWSMVHFLAEGDGGKYQRPFVNYMTALARGMDAPQAWTQIFGRETQAFEDAWKKYWQNLRPNATAVLQRQAKLMTLVSFVSHSAKTGKKYNTFDEFCTAARAGNIKLPLDPANWLPPEMLASALRDIDPAQINLTWNTGTPKLVEKQKDGTTITATYDSKRVVSTTQPAAK